MKTDEDIMADNMKLSFAEKCEALQASLARLTSAFEDLRQSAATVQARHDALVKQQATEVAETKAGLAAVQAALEEERARRCRAEARVQVELERRTEQRAELLRLASAMEVLERSPRPSSDAEDVGQVDTMFTEPSARTKTPVIKCAVEHSGEKPTLSCETEAAIDEPEMKLSLPADIAAICRDLVAGGLAPDMASAAMELMRRGARVSSTSVQKRRTRRHE
jgi:hypothetical protein